MPQCAGQQAVPEVRVLRRWAGAAAAVVALVSAAQPAAARPAAGMDATERLLVRLINAERQGRGLPALRVSALLSRSADDHSLDMAAHNVFEHASSDGTPMDVRVRRFFRARIVGENLAWVRSRGDAARAILVMWLGSAQHREILHTAAFRRIGVGWRPGWMEGGPAMLLTADFSTAR